MTNIGNMESFYSENIKLGRISTKFPVQHVEEFCAIGCVLSPR